MQTYNDAQYNNQKSRQSVGYNIYIFLIVFATSGFCGLYRILPLSSSVYITTYINLSIIVISLITAFFVSIFRRSIIINNKFRYVFLLYLLLISIEIVKTTLYYNESVSSVLYQAFLFLTPLIALFAFYQFRMQRNMGEFTFDVICNIAAVSSIVAIITFVLYTYNGVNILNLIDVSTSHYRNGSIRIDFGLIVNYLAVLISIGRIIEKRKIRKSFFVLALVAIQMIFVTQTRSAIIAVVIVVLIDFLFIKKRSRQSCIVIGLLIVLLFGLMLFNSTVIIESTSNTLLTDISISHRFKEIEYYFNQFLSNPFLGTGFLSTSVSSKNAYILFGPTLSYYRDDVGIVGLINQWGCLGLLWCIFFLGTAMKQIKNNSGSIYLRNLLFFIIITLVNMSFMDPQRIMYIFFLIVFLELRDQLVFEEDNARESEIELKKYILHTKKKFENSSGR